MSEKMNVFLPFEGIDNVRFGMDRLTVRKNINKPYKVFTRNEFASNTTDYFDDLGMFIEYDDNDLCEAIEFADSGSVFYGEMNLFDMGYRELRRHFDPSSSNKEEDDAGVIYHDLGFGVSRSSDPDNAISTVILFSENYWG